MSGRFDEPVGSKRICYSCGSSYPDGVRFCPKDSTDLEFSQPLDSISSNFERPRGWVAVCVVSALLLVIAGAIIGMWSSMPAAETADRGELTVRTIPEGARVYLDGSQVGVSPVRLSDIPSGVHEVRAVFPGYLDGKAHVDILPSATQKLVWDLSPLPSSPSRSPSRNNVKDRKKFIAELLPAVLPPTPRSSEQSI